MDTKMMEDLKDAFYEFVEKSEAKSEEVEALKVPNVVQRQRQEKKLCDSLAKQVELCSKSITSSIDKINTEVRKMGDGEESPAKVQSLMSILQSLDEKIDGTLSNLINQYIGLLLMFSL